MPLNDYKCERCDFIIEKLEFGKEVNQEHICPKCGHDMVLLFPTTMNFKLIYNNKKDVSSWGAEGYSTSQYNRLKDNKEK